MQTVSVRELPSSTAGRDLLFNLHPQFSPPTTGVRVVSPFFVAYC